MHCIKLSQALTVLGELYCTNVLNDNPMVGKRGPSFSTAG